MMKERNHILALALLCCLAFACTKDLSHSGIDPESGRDLVPVTLNLAVSSLEMPDQVGHNGTTKTVYDPDMDGSFAGTDAEIKTILVLQFEDNGAGDKVRVGNQQFFDHWPLLAGENIALVASSVENTIFVIANAWGEIPLAGGTMLSSFLASQGCSLIDTLDDLGGNGIWYSPDAGVNRYLRMSGSMVVPKVELGSSIGTDSIPLELKRNCAKVVINVRNSSTSPDKVTIDKVQLCDINRKYYYVTNFSGFKDPYSPMTPYRFDNAEEDFPAAYNTSGATQTYTYYVPVNLSGTITNAAQSSKNMHAPQGATRFCIYTRYGSPERNITYTYYLGANLQDDFNLLPNHKYTYTIDINGLGNPSTDSRIDDMDKVTFSLDANCYMLNPSNRTDKIRTFRIPVRRAAVFWNETGTNMGVYGAGNSMQAYTLNETDTWEAFFVWNEVIDKNGDPVPDGNLLVTATGTGFNPQLGGQPYVTIQVAEGMRGNALLALKKTTVGKTNDDILWSWHLWVTDYNPYTQVQPVADTYIYSVWGGEVHRYGGDTWASAKYANAFMMDRQLGAMTSPLLESKDETKKYCLYYEFGRKDPIRYNGITKINAGSTGQPPEGSGLKRNIPYSVHNPNMFFLYDPGPWTAYEDGGNVLGADSAIWMDPKFEAHGPDNCEPGKSIYDPCPPGWMVPEHGTWSDFDATTTEWSTSVPIGLFYYPGGYDPLAPKGRIPYRAMGYRDTYWHGDMYNLDQNGRSWSSTPKYCLAFSDGAVNPNGSPRRADGVSVRCIRLNYTRPY